MTRCISTRIWSLPAVRDMYRHAVERLAKRCRLEEVKVATAAVGLALDAARHESTDVRDRHVGFYLIDEGRPQLELRLGYRPPIGEQLSRFVKAHAVPAYLGGIGLVTAAAVAAVFIAARSASGSVAAAFVAALLFILPGSELAIGLINALVTHLLQPRALPKVEFKDQVPPPLPDADRDSRDAYECSRNSRPARTSRDSPSGESRNGLAICHVDRLRRRAPGRIAGRLHACSNMARLGVRAAQHSLLRRSRRPIPSLASTPPLEPGREGLDGVGAEACGSSRSSICMPAAGIPRTVYLPGPKSRLDRLRGIKYVITLDADTRLPYGVAKRLIGTLAHPLNRPHFDDDLGRVTKGYGILQPRVGISLASAGRSIFARLFANSPGLDPYCMAVSDVYQDLFSEGSYTGKGIYDVDAFSAAVDPAFPENHILSHDLIEGCYARVGLVTDLEVFDDYPLRHDAEARRQHRWVRGDWQLLPWLMPVVPTAAGWQANSLTGLARWKIFDNLRRSLVAPGLVVFFLTGWLAYPPLAAVVTSSALAILATPLFAQTLSALVSWPSGINWRQHLHDMAVDWLRTLAQCLLTLAFLPYRAQLMVDAVVRTLYRLVSDR